MDTHFNAGDTIGAVESVKSARYVLLYVGIVVIVAGDALQAETMESGRSGEVAAGLNALTALDNAMRETG
jgi:hypothetical protein